MPRSSAHDATHSSVSTQSLNPSAAISNAAQVYAPGRPPARVPLEHTARAGGRHRVEALARRAAPCEAGVRTEEDYLCFRRAEDDQETERGEELGGHGIILDALAM